MLRASGHAVMSAQGMLHALNLLLAVCHTERAGRDGVGANSNSAGGVSG